MLVFMLCLWLPTLFFFLSSTIPEPSSRAYLPQSQWVEGNGEVLQCLLTRLHVHPTHPEICKKNFAFTVVVSSHVEENLASYSVQNARRPFEACHNSI